MQEQQHPAGAFEWTMMLLMLSIGGLVCYVLIASSCHTPRVRPSGPGLVGDCAARTGSDRATCARLVYELKKFDEAGGRAH